MCDGTGGKRNFEASVCGITGKCVKKTSTIHPDIHQSLSSAAGIKTGSRLLRDRIHFSEERGLNSLMSQHLFSPAVIIGRGEGWLAGLRFILGESLMRQRPHLALSSNCVHLCMYVKASAPEQG